MDAVADYLAIIAARAEAENPANPDDYMQDGLLYCGKCRTPKQCRPFPDKSVAVSCVCKCKEDEDAKLRTIRNEQEVQRRRIQCFQGYDGVMKTDIRNTFGEDDSAQSEASQAIRGFAKNPPGWLLLFGGTGTGKSFYAGCICNEMISNGHRCKFTSVSEIADAVFSAEDKAAVYADLKSFDLVVLDDLGAERRTEYMNEITFRIIDTLLRNSVSVVVTTNLTMRELMTTEDEDMRRIYSRICQKAVPIPVKGEDRRVKIMMSTAKSRMQELMEGGKDELCGYTEVDE